ncbi:MAG: LysM domain-containing protein [Thermoleophilia bacterium]
MNYQIESKIIKALAIAALAVALFTMGIITANTGIIGGGSSEAAETGDTAIASSGESASAQATPATATRNHVVQDGDSFYSIARKYDTSISEIQKLNPNIDPQHLTAGIRLAIP